MAQTQILAAGTTAATSTDVTLTTGAIGNVTGFTSGTDWPAGGYMTVLIDTNADDQPVAVLDTSNRTIRLVGPGTWRVKRGPVSAALGASSEV